MSPPSFSSLVAAVDFSGVIAAMLGIMGQTVGMYCVYIAGKIVLGAMAGWAREGR